MELTQTENKDTLRILATALSVSSRTMRRDGCGDWRIEGRSGYIYPWGDGETWVLFVACRSTRHWTATKRKLAFCEVTQEGDDEGCLRLLHAPPTDEAAIIRGALGIRKRRKVSGATLATLREHGAKHRFPARESANSSADGAQAA